MLLPEPVSTRLRYQEQLVTGSYSTSEPLSLPSCSGQDYGETSPGRQVVELNTEVNLGGGDRNLIVSMTARPLMNP